MRLNLRGVILKIGLLILDTKNFALMSAKTLSLNTKIKAPLLSAHKIENNKYFILKAVKLI